MWNVLLLTVSVVILVETTSGFVLDSFKNLGPTCIRCDNTSSWTACSEVACDKDEECYVYVTEPHYPHQHIDFYSINAGCIKRPFCNNHRDHQDDIKVVCDTCCPEDNCILDHCAHRLHLQHPLHGDVNSCNLCKKRNGKWECDSTQSCGHHQVCFVQESIYRREIHYKSGCIKEKECDTVTLGQVGNDVRLFHHVLGDTVPMVTAGRCCYTSRCNTISSLRPPPPTTTTVPTTTSITTPVPVPTRQCEVCSGQSCDGSLTSCPSDSSLCMTELDNDHDGQKVYTKSCGTTSTCEEKWLKETIIKPECIGFHPDSTYTFSFNCTFCCTTDGCNRDDIPSVDSLYLKT